MAVPVYRSQVARPDTTATAGLAQATQQQFSTLSQRIGQFTNVQYGQEVKEAKIQASDDAQKSFLEGGESRRLKEDNTIYAETFNDRMRGLNTKQAVLDANDAASQYAEQFKLDPVSFNETFTNYKKEVISKASNADTANLSLSLASIGASHFSKLQSDHMARVKEKEIAINDNFSEQMKRDIGNASYEGNFQQMVHFTDEQTKFLQEQYELGNMSQEQVDKEIKSISRTSLSNQLQGINDRLITKKDYDNAQKGIDDFRSVTHADLSVKERDAIADGLQADLNQSLAKEVASERVIGNANKKLIKDKISLLEAGHKTAWSEELYNSASPQDKVLLDEARVVNSTVLKYKSMQPNNLSAVVSVLENKKNTTIEEKKVYKVLKRMESENREMLKNDPYQLATKQGIITQRSPMPSVTTMRAGEFGMYLKSYLPDAITVSSQYGQPVGVFDPDTAKQIAVDYTQMNAQEKIGLVAEINTLPQDIALKTFEQVSKGGSNQMAMVGSLVFQGQSAAAENIIKGSDYIKSGYQPPRAMSSQVLAKLSKVSDGFTVETRKMFTKSIIDMYAYKVTQSEKALDINELGVQIVDPTMLKESMNEVLGGVVKSPNGNDIIAPKYGMSEDRTEEWIDGLTVDDINNMGGISSAGGKEASKEEVEAILNDIKNNSSVKLIPKGTGKYYIKYGAGYIGNRDGTNFILEYKE